MTKDKKLTDAGQHSHEHDWGLSETGTEEQNSMRGGTREQHVKAGRAGGKAPHKCRGRQCTAESKK